MSTKTCRRLLHCQFPGELKEISSVASFVKFSCESFDYFDDEFIMAIQESVNQAFSHICAHSYKLEPLPIIVECQKVNDGLLVKLFDTGEPFSAKQGTTALTKVFSSMDTVEFAPKTKKEEWNQLHLFKKYCQV